MSEMIRYTGEKTLTPDFRSDSHQSRFAKKIRSWSHGHVTKPGNDQLPHIQARARRVVLRAHLRSGDRLGVPVRKIQTHEASRRDLRQMRRRGHTGESPPRGGWATSSWPAPALTSGSSKGLPSRIGHLLDIPLRELEKVSPNYIVIADKEDVDSLGLPLKEREMVTDERYRQLKQEFPGKFTDEVCKMGAEAIKTLLQKVDVDDLAEGQVQDEERDEPTKKLKFSKRLKVVDSFRKSGNKPEWMILDVIPVIPPELRPLVPLDGGRFATSDLTTSIAASSTATTGFRS